MECKKCGEDLVFYFFFNSWTCDNIDCKYYMKKLCPRCRLSGIVEREGGIYCDKCGYIIHNPVEKSLLERLKKYELYRICRIIGRRMVK